MVYIQSQQISLLPEDGCLLGVHADGVLRVLVVPQPVGLDVAAAAQDAAVDAQPDRLGGTAS